jgi:hypothetical protein
LFAAGELTPVPKDRWQECSAAVPPLPEHQPDAGDVAFSPILTGKDDEAWPPRVKMLFPKNVFNPPSHKCYAAVRHKLQIMK